MFLARFDQNLRVADFFDFRGKFGAQFFANFRRNSSGATIRDNSLRVERRKIRARRKLRRALVPFPNQALR